MAESKKRRCNAKTRSGKPCRAWALKGHLVCLSHADEAVRAEMSFGGSENGAKGGAATRKAKPLEVLREKVEGDIERWLKPYEDALDAVRPVLVGYGEDAYVEMIPDHKMRVSATEAVHNRLYGRPKTVTESKVEVTSRSQMDREIERLTEQLSRNGHEPART